MWLLKAADQKAVPVTALAQLSALHPGMFESITTSTFANGTAIFPPTIRSNAKLPVVVFSPGSGSLAAFYTAFTSLLALYGYVVVGVDHLYDSKPLELPDGTLIFDVLTDVNNTLAAEIRRTDVTCLATQLTPPNLLSWLNVRSELCLELSSLPKISLMLGIVGQPIGGTTVVLAMQSRNTSYAPAASLDGPVLTDSFQGPFFYMAANNSGNHAALQGIWGKVEGWKEAVVVGCTMHDSYTDAVVLVPQVDAGSGLALEYGKNIGTIDRERMVKVITKYLKAFWDWTLLGQEEKPLLKGEVKEFPEVVFEIL
jgi:dienelactone hydrolase